MWKRPSHTVASIARDAQRTACEIAASLLGRLILPGGLGGPWENDVSCAFTCPRRYAKELREEYSKIDSRHSQHEIVPSSHSLPLEFRRWRWSAYVLDVNDGARPSSFEINDPAIFKGSEVGEETDTFFPFASHVSIFIEGAPQSAAWTRRVTPGVGLRCKITRVGRVFVVCSPRVQRLSARQLMFYLGTQARHARKC